MEQKFLPKPPSPLSSIGLSISSPRVPIIDAPAAVQPRTKSFLQGEDEAPKSFQPDNSTSSKAGANTLNGHNCRNPPRSTTPAPSQPTNTALSVHTQLLAVTSSSQRTALPASRNGAEASLSPLPDIENLSKPHFDTSTAPIASQSSTNRPSHTDESIRSDGILIGVAESGVVTKQRKSLEGPTSLSNTPQIFIRNKQTNELRTSPSKSPDPKMVTQNLMPCAAARPQAEKSAKAQESGNGKIESEL